MRSSRFGPLPRPSATTYHRPDSVSPACAKASLGHAAGPLPLVSAGTCPVLMMRRRPGHALAAAAAVG